MNLIMTNETITIIISVLALIVSIINILYAKHRIDKFSELHNKSFNYTQNKDKDDFILNFKNDLNEFRLSMTELYTTKKEIKVESKGNLLYILESKYNKSIIEKYLNNSIYNQFMDLKIKTDESLDKVIYNSDFSSISSSIDAIKCFFDNVNSHINGDI
ncbi:MAG: hypothetical protein JJV95_05690 [Sulfurospirillum sp.]|nr:hypothetical protein [Sulfurospirillum sp.]MBL0703458.1 hypothetical protein [Sulfurospirillum sp.]